MKKLIIFTIFFAILSYLFFDTKIAYSLSKIDSWQKDIAIFITRFGLSKYYIIISLIVAITFYRFKRGISFASFYIFLSIITSGLIINIIKFIVARYRPPLLLKENLYGFNWFEHGYLVNSFPSGHATTAFAFYGSLALLFPKFKIFFLAIALIIALSRVILDVHYLSDVLIGSLIGYLSAYMLYNKFYKVRIGEL